MSITLVMLSCTLPQSSIKVKEDNHIVTIDNGIVSVNYKLESGTYDMCDLLKDQIVIQNAVTAVNEEYSDDKGYVHTWDVQNISDELGEGKRLIITSTKSGSLTQKMGFTLYPNDGIIAYYGGVVNTGIEPIQILSIAPLARCQAFLEETIYDYALLNGYSGDQETRIQRVGKIDSHNNGLFTFGKGDDMRSVSLGGLKYNEFIKRVKITPNVDFNYEYYVGSPPLCYIDLSLKSSPSKSEGGESLSVTKGKGYEYTNILSWKGYDHVNAPNSSKYGLHYSSVIYDDKYCELELTGLDPAKKYSFGFSTWDIENADRNGKGQSIRRKQSTTILNGKTKAEKIIFESKVLNNNLLDEAPGKFTFTIPQGDYPTGTVYVRMYNEAGVNSVLANAWLVEGETKNGKNVTNAMIIDPNDHICGYVNLQLYSQDPYGRCVDPGVEYFPEKDAYYIDFMTSNPFESLEKYGLSFKKAQHVNLNVYNFPTLCLWYVSHFDVTTKGAKTNTTTGAVEAMQGVKESGFLNYSPVSVRLVPDYYGPGGTGGSIEGGSNSQQGWWDDKHWQMYTRKEDKDGNGQYIPPYETTKKWASAVIDLGGVPLTYFQASAVSRDYVEHFPEHTLFNLGKCSAGFLNNSYSDEIGYDFTDPGFQEYMRKVYKNLYDGGVKGLMFDYPGTAWEKKGGFEDKYATTAVNYKNVFKLAKEGLGPDSYIHERGLETGYDLTFGDVDSYRTEWDCSVINERMVTRAGLRWYKNRVVIQYDLDSKDLLRVKSIDELNSLITMINVVSSRVVLSTDFRVLGKKELYSLSRIYPQHLEAKSHRPVDAFVNTDYPQVYDFEINKNWHNVVFYNGSLTEEDVVEIHLSGNTALGSLGLNPNHEYHVYDFWNNVYVGKFKGSDCLQQELRKGESRVFSIKKTEDYPQLVSTDRHVFQGYLDTENVEWKNNTIIGTSKVIENEEYNAYIKLPEGNKYKIGKVDVSDGVKVDTNEKEGMVILTLNSNKNTNVNWSIELID